MQRAVASSPSKTALATSPTSTSPKKSYINHQQQKPSSKRQRLSDGSPAAISSTSVSGEGQSYDDAMRAALAAEEALRVQADERRAKVRGESRWALSFMNPQYPTGREVGDGGQGSRNPVLPLQVVTAGYGDIDAFTAGKGEIGRDKNSTSTFKGSNESNSMQGSSSNVGRRTFGKYKRRALEVPFTLPITIFIIFLYVLRLVFSHLYLSHAF